MRSDARLIRAIAKDHGNAVAVAWQHLPLVTLPRELGTELERYYARAVEGEFRDAKMELPWIDVVFDIAGGLSPVEHKNSQYADKSLHAWIRVTTPEEAASPSFARSCPWIAPAILARLVNDPRHIVIQSWELWMDPESDLPVLFGPALVILDKDKEDATVYCTSPRCTHEGDAGHAIDHEVSDAFHEEAKAAWCDHNGVSPEKGLVELMSELDHLSPDERYRALQERHGDLTAYRGRLDSNLARLRWLQAHSTMRFRALTAVLMAYLVTAYLTQCDEYVVSVQPTAQRGERGAASPKPWTRTDLPSLILIDPGRVAEYGHPSGARERGHHASPRPHGRRGHWRHFRADRYSELKRGQRTWIRPMWVGDREWAAGGQHYSVVWPPADAEGAERVTERRPTNVP